MPALEKNVIDVQASDGLEQKTDIRRLPIGKSAQAVNLVKNKQGMLQKRLGFQSLNSTTVIGGPNYVPSAGLSLGAFNGDLFTVTRGVYSANNALSTVLCTYSDDLGGAVFRGQVPELNVTSDAIVSNTPNFAMNPMTAINGDYQVEAWIDCFSPQLVPTIQTGNLWYSVREISTGNLVIAPTLLVSGGAVAVARLISVGTFFVLCYQNTTANIGCYTQTTAGIASGFVSRGNIVTTSSVETFDLRAADNDSLHFVLAWQTGDPRSSAASIIVDQRTPALPGTVVQTWTVATGQTLGLSCIAVRANPTSTNLIAVAYCQNTNPVSTPYNIYGALGNYTTFTVVCAPAGLYTALDQYENNPAWIDVAFCGSGGQLLGASFNAAWSPWGCVWNCIKHPGAPGLTQSNPNRLATGSLPGDGYTPSNNARVIMRSFFNNGGTLGFYGSSGDFTAGVTLASRGMEANGIVYYLGWVPSLTQGGYIAMAFDQAQNHTYAGNQAPMRPVAYLQVRSALADPGDGRFFLFQGSVNPTVSVASYGPNTWTGGSEWPVSPNGPYGNSYVAYLAGSQGQRLQPASGVLQTTPQNGPQSCQWGTMAAMAGAVPTVFDGQNVFEQGYPYIPESIVAFFQVPTNSSGPSWAGNNDSFSWICTWEQFDAQGNFHQSARSTPVVILGSQVVAAGGSLGTTYQVQLYVPTLGPTMRQWPFTYNHSLMNLGSAPTAPVVLGVYRTGISTGPFASTYFRVTDRFYNGMDPSIGTGTGQLPLLVTNALNTTDVSFTDWTNNSEIVNGTHPLLYGDGTNGSPGSLDNFCPMATQVMVRHKERLFTANGNLIMFTKARGERAGPGYNEQVNAIFVGGDDPIIAMESMDDKLIVFKSKQVFYVAGDGPADDGSGSSFGNPQPIPTDSGCDDENVKATPEGVYFMSTAGLRLVSRSLAIEYVGGPIEDELNTYGDVRGIALYPAQNKVIFAITAGDTGGGELVYHDYVLKAWTTAVIAHAPISPGVFPMALTVANAPQTTGEQPVLHFMDYTGTTWRERDPGGATPYYDNVTYVSSTWVTPLIKQQDAARFRLWDILAFGKSVDPHGLQVQVALDNGNFAAPVVWTWNTPGGHNIAPGGTSPTPLTQVRTYDGRLGEAFQLQITDVADTASVTGQGFQVLGFTLTTGVYRGPYKLPGGQTQ